MQGVHRRIIALSGARHWCHAAARTLLADHPPHDLLWAGDEVPAGLELVPFARNQQLLGDEYGAAVIDGWAGFDPEQFGVVSGTVRGGGALLLLLPTDWPSHADPAQQRITVWPHSAATMPNRFIARAWRILQHDAHVEWLSDTTPLPPPLRLALPPAVAPQRQQCRSDEQRAAVAAVHHVVSGHRKRPLVLLADRGRGKSAALGIAAAELLRAGAKRIVVTAPHRNAVAALFAHAAPYGITMPNAPASPALAEELQRFLLPPSAAVLEFIPPDELLRRPVNCDLLLVDEAAAIPTPLLTQLLHHYHRIAFATTVHGYEGNGRGFALRFFKVLDALTPGWQQRQLREPIRWGSDDPLERLTFALLQLDAAPAAAAPLAEATPDQCRFEQLSAAQLQSDDALLAELFGLLVLAHYRTSPLDLRQLLDSPHLAIHIARAHGQLIAAVVTLREGGFDEALAVQIHAGLRRPRGHLAPQALAVYCGLPEAPPLTTVRIMRIAVHPALQQRGIGGALLQHVAAAALASGCDYLSASFGISLELLRFWQRHALLPVRIGMAREAASGSHSALVMRPFTPAAMALFARARQRFLTYLPLQLSEPLQDIDPAVTLALLGGEWSAPPAALDEDDWRDLVSFACGRRGYEVCMGPIHALTRQLLRDGALLQRLTAQQRALLIAKVVQQQPWDEVARAAGVAGQQQASDLLRTTLRSLLLQLAAPRVVMFEAALSATGASQRA